MSKKHHGGPGPVPAGNRQKRGRTRQPDADTPTTGEVREGGEVPAQQEDPERRMGDFTGTARHSIHEPGGKNGADH